MALLAGRGEVSPEVRFHVDECASCRQAMGRLLGVFYVAAAYEAFRLGIPSSNRDDHLGDSLLRSIFQSVDATYREQFGHTAENDLPPLVDLRRLIDLAVVPTPSVDDSTEMPADLAASIFQNVDHEYQRRFTNPSADLRPASTSRNDWARPVRWAAAAALLIAVSVGVIALTDVIPLPDPVAVIQPEVIRSEVDVEPQRERTESSTVDDEGRAKDDPHRQRLAKSRSEKLRRMMLQIASQQKLPQTFLLASQALGEARAAIRSDLPETLAWLKRLANDRLAEGWRRFADDTIAEARRAIEKRNYGEADLWLQKALVAIDAGGLSDPREPVLFARLRCQRQQIALSQSAVVPAAQFESLLQIYTELAETLAHPQPAAEDKIEARRDRLRGEAIRIAQLASSASRSADVIAVLWPYRDALDAEATAMFATARRDMGHQVDRLVGTGQLAATYKVSNWLRSRARQLSHGAEPGS